jgi:hypothetical protein
MRPKTLGSGRSLHRDITLPNSNHFLSASTSSSFVTILEGTTTVQVLVSQSTASTFDGSDRSQPRSNGKFSGIAAFQEHH